MKKVLLSRYSKSNSQENSIENEKYKISRNNIYVLYMHWYLIAQTEFTI